MHDKLIVCVDHFNVFFSISLRIEREPHFLPSYKSVELALQLFPVSLQMSSFFMRLDRIYIVLSSLFSFPGCHERFEFDLCLREFLTSQRLLKLLMVVFLVFRFESGILKHLLWTITSELDNGQCLVLVQYIEQLQEICCQLDDSITDWTSDNQLLYLFRIDDICSIFVLWA